MGLKYNPFTGSFDFTGVAPSTLSNYVLKSGDTMTGTLTFSGGSAPTLGKIFISQVSNVSTAGIVITNSTVGAALRAWVDGANYVRIDNSSMADKGILFNGQGTGGIGIQTTATTHSVTLGSTATGIALYNTPDQTTNYERVRQYWSGDAFYIYSQSGGTGVARPILLKHTYNGVDVQLAVNRAGTTDTAFVSVNQVGLTTVSNVSILKLLGTAAHSSSTYYGLSIVPTINQSSTAGYTALLINPTETSTGSGAKYLIQAQLGGSDRFRVDAATGNIFTTGWLGSGGITPTATIDAIGSNTNRASLRIRSGTAPTSPNDGDIWYDGTDLKMRVGGTTKTFTLT